MYIYICTCFHSKIVEACEWVVVRACVSTHVNATDLRLYVDTHADVVGGRFGGKQACDKSSLEDATNATAMTMEIKLGKLGWTREEDYMGSSRTRSRLVTSTTVSHSPANEYGIDDTPSFRGKHIESQFRLSRVRYSHALNDDRSRLDASRRSRYLRAILVQS